MIKLQNVSKFYYSKGIIASGITKVNLDLDVGEFVVITGESGSGKSTLLNVISGLDTYEEGEMYIDGEETSHYTAGDFEQYRKKYIGNIFQSFNLVTSYTAAQNVALAMEINGSAKKDIKTKVPEMLAKVGMSEYAKTKVSKLSGGQKQRVAIARALAKDTKIIVADEPTGNLDSESAAGIVEVLTSLAKDRLVIVVTHNFEQFKDHATRIIKMHDGRIVEDTGIKTARERALMESAEPAATNGSVATETGTAADIAENGNADTVASTGADFTTGDKATSAATETVMAADAAENGNAGTVANTGADSTTGDPATTPATDIEDSASAASVADSTTTDPATTTTVAPSGRMRVGTQTKLGVRNTFNIVAKFLLLLIVFLFVVSSVTSQYVSVKKMRMATKEIGWNSYFTNYDASRLILEREDRGPFTEEDYETISKVKNIKSLVKDDMVMDTEGYIESPEFSFFGYFLGMDLLEGRKIDYGALPTEDQPNGVVIESTTVDYLGVEPSQILGKEYTLESAGGMKVVITGVTLTGEDSQNTESGVVVYGGGDEKMYLTDEMLQKVRMYNNANMSRMYMEVNGQRVSLGMEGEFNIVANDMVNEGQVILPAAFNEYYENGYVYGRVLPVAVHNIFYTQEMELTCQTTYAKWNYLQVTGLENFEDHDGEIYVNPKDYETLFAKGNYQATVYAKNSRDVDEVKAALESAGYDVLALRDHAGNMFDSEVLSILQLPFAVAACVVVFFIAYLVTRLILRSRSGYFAILRMLGAERKQAKHIMDVEILLVAVIAFCLYLGFIYLAVQGIIPSADLQDMVLYLKTRDFVVLGVILLVMALGISHRFMRTIFKQSAMGVYREEV